MNNSIGLYIHIPYCARKCAYCDFVSYSDKCETVGAYVRALAREINSYDKMNINVKTVFFGGGTPSFIDSRYIEHLLENIRKVFNVTVDAEISLECNPGTVDIEKLRAYKNMGINRLSIGVQSFNDNILAKLGRIHNSSQAISTFEMAHNAGFDNINADLMLGTPGQTVDIAKQDVKTAISLGVSHISAYSLILEDGTPLANDVKNGIISVPDTEKEYEISSVVSEYLSNNGFSRYEVSNYAKRGFECKHNLIYWDCEDYIGLGLAAHSCYNSKRFNNTAVIEEYINDKYLDEQYTLTPIDHLEEYVMLSLRTVKGMSMGKLSRLADIAGKSGIENKIYQMLDDGLLVMDNGFVAASPRGFEILNKVILDLVY